MANIELDGLNKTIKVDSGDLTLDVPGDIVLDADGGDITFADGGTNLLKITNSSSDVVFQPQVDAKDIVFKQYDGTVVATVEDNATFNVPTGKLAINGTAITSTAAELNILDGVTSTASEINLLDGGTSVGSSITLADADGVIVNDNGTMKTIPVSDVKTYVGGFDVSSITGATDMAETPATTDEINISDGGTLKRIDYNFFNNHNSPYCFYLDTNGFSSSQSISANTWTTITNFDSNGSVSSEQQSGSLSSTLSSNGRFTPGMQGWYYVSFGCQMESVENGVEINTVAYSSHSDHSFTLSRYNTGGGGSVHYNMGSAVLSATANTYFSFAIKHTDGAGSRNVTRAKVSIFRLPTYDLP